MSSRYLLFLFLIACWPVQAQVFKCVAANGDLTYSQTPCPEKDSKVTVQRVSTAAKDDAADCEYAHRFALTTAMRMKRGVESSEIFDQYGGLSALSRGSVSLISYVYQYRTNDDVSAERVAALSLAKCQANSFGDVGCDQLPRTYTNQLGGCEIPEQIADTMMDEMMMRESGVQTPPVTSAATTRQARTRITPEARSRANAERRQAREREEQRQEQCKQRIQRSLDAINAEMRSGYSASRGITLRERRRELEQELREC